MDPERGQPDQARRAGEIGVYPINSGEVDGGSGLPCSRLAYKHLPTFSGQNQDFIPWTRDARVPCKRRFLLAFASISPQYVPVGELDTENMTPVQRGFSLERVQRHALAWDFLSTALKSKSDKGILYKCASPREAWDALLAWYGLQMAGAKSDLSTP